MRIALGQPFEKGYFLDPTHPEFEHAAIVELARELNKATVMAFVGTGVTVPYGRPPWSKLVNDVVTFTIGQLKEALDGRGDSPAKAGLEVIRDHLEAFKDMSEPQKLIAGDRRVLALELCREALEAIGRRGLFEHQVSELFRKREPIEHLDPLRALLEDLGVRRLLTTNYDDEIETYVRDKRLRHRVRAPGESRDVEADAGLDDTSLPRKPFASASIARRDSPQGPLVSAELVRLALRLPGTDRGVFHLHGHVPMAGTGEAPWLIIGERDYRELYLGSDATGRLYREALDLALRANTILFVGLGMSEEDILRSLRQFVAELPKRSDRSLFALLETPLPKIWETDGIPADPKEVERQVRFLQLEQRHTLLTRYGVRVIFGQTWEQARTMAALYAAKGRIGSRPDKIDSKQHATLLAHLGGRHGLIPSSKLLDRTPGAIRTAVADFVNEQDRGPSGMKLRETFEYCRQNIDSDPAEACRRLVTLYHTGTLLAKLRDIRVQRDLWWEDWLALPKARAASFRRRGDRLGAETMVTRHRLGCRSVEMISRLDEEQLDKLKQGLVARPHPSGLVAITARRGAGRGSLGYWLAHDRAKFKAFVNAMGPHVPHLSEPEVYGFLAPTHFSSEFLSVIDATIDFLDFVARGGERPEDIRLRREELPDILKRLRVSGRGVLLVFSGVERLLDEAGRLFNDDLRDLFRKLAEAAGFARLTPILDHSVRVVLLGRDGPWIDALLRDLAPTDADPALVKAAVDVAKVALPFIPIEKFKNVLCGPGTGLPKACTEPLGQLAEACRGHKYAVMVVARLARLCERAGSRQPKSTPGGGYKFLERIARDLSRRAPHRQGEKIVEMTIEHLRRELLSLLWDDREQWNRELKYITDELKPRLEQKILRTLQERWKDMAGDKPSDEQKGREQKKAQEESGEEVKSFGDKLPRTLLDRVLQTLALAPAPIERGTLEFLVFDPEAEELRLLWPERSALPRTPFLAGEGGLPPIKGLEPLWEALLSILVQVGFVYHFEPRSAHKRELEHHEATLRLFHRYAVHSLVRRHLRRGLGQESTPFAEGAYYELSGYIAGGGSPPALNPQGMRLAAAFADRLVGGRASELTPAQRERVGKHESFVEAELKAARMRSAVHVIRSSLPLAQVLHDDSERGASAGRWQASGRLHEHRRRIIQLLDGVRQAQGLEWRKVGIEAGSGESKVRKPEQHRATALYADELIWVYNEFAVVCLAQGDVIEARSLIDQMGRLRRKEQGDDGAIYARYHGLLLEGFLEIERGELSNADRQLKRVSEQFPDEQHFLGARARGFLGIIDHLRCDYEKAHAAYTVAIEVFRDLGRARASSVFERYLGDLHRARGNWPEARAAYELSAVAAVTHPDLYHYTRIAQARLDLDQEEREPSRAVTAAAVASLEAAAGYAHRVGLPRMEGEAALTRAALRLQQGELDGAADTAREALAIFTSRQLQPRAVSALVLLGKILRARGDLKVARLHLEDARQWALRMRYVKKAEEALEELVAMRRAG